MYAEFHFVERGEVFCVPSGLMYDGVWDLYGICRWTGK
jgi:hypothetical protein